MDARLPFLMTQNDESEGGRGRGSLLLRPFSSVLELLGVEPETWPARRQLIINRGIYLKHWQAAFSYFEQSLISVYFNSFGDCTQLLFNRDVHGEFSNSNIR